MSGITYAPEAWNVQAISTACCVLHNLLIDMDPRGVQVLADVEDPINHEVRPGV